MLHAYGFIDLRLICLQDGGHKVEMTKRLFAENQRGRDYFTLFDDGTKPPLDPPGEESTHGHDFDAFVEAEHQIADHSVSRWTKIKKKLGGEKAKKKAIADFYTPERFLTACETGHTEMVKMCLVHELPVTTKNPIGENALHIACQFGHGAIVKLLLARPLGGAEKATYAQLHVKDGTDKVGEQHWSPMHHAVHNVKENVVQILLDAKVNLEKKDYNGSTPLMMACQMKSIGIIKRLIKGSANFDMQDNEGRAALHFAATKCPQEIVNLLVQCGAKTRLKDHQGHTAADYAKLVGRRWVSVRF